MLFHDRPAACSDEKPGSQQAMLDCSVRKGRLGPVTTQSPPGALPTGTPKRRSLLDRLFGPVRVPPETTGELADVSRRGSVVFVVRSAGILSFLYLGWLLRNLGLPPLRAALGLTGIRSWLFRVRPSKAALEDALARGDTSLVFLRGGSGPDPFDLLLSIQARSPRPILLVPSLLVWTRRPRKLKPTVVDLLFGTPDRPSPVASAIGFIINRDRAVLRVGRAIDLADFLRERASEPAAVLARKVRSATHLYLAREMRSVVGPALKTLARTRDQVLRDKGLRGVIEHEARVKRRPIADVERKAEKALQEIAARYSPVFIELLGRFITWLFGRLYEAVDIDEEGIARVKRAAGQAPLVLCPSHKSYIDFLVISWALYERGMTPPHIAAGLNLAFWPFGAIARRGGTFFIRRARADPVYTATLRAYVKQLLRDRFAQEFYIEGTRSRTGKLLTPKTGLVAMEIEAWLDQASQDILFVPISIDYELLVESRSHALELSGGEKQQETIWGLLRARKALRRRYGRLTVQFDEPISLRAFAAERLAIPPEQLLADEIGASARHGLAQALTSRIAYGINRAATVTPVGLLAAALLSDVRRGLPAQEVVARVELLRYLAAEDAARFSRSLPGAPSDPRLPGPMADALALLTHEGLVHSEQAAGEIIYQAVDERRALLDYHKNAVLHRFVPMALLASALRSTGEGTKIADLGERTLWLSRLLQLEFTYRVGAAPEVFAESAAMLVRLGIATQDGELFRPAARRELLDFLADLLRPYVEAYMVTAEALSGLDGAGASVDRKTLVKASLEQGRAAYAAGRIALRESLSKATFENAADWFGRQGAFSTESDRRCLSPEWRDSLLPELLEKLKLQLAHGTAPRARS